ncbi:lipase secretion chaperone [Desulforegula conservatrix]|uniref:lipase secretion chaperone n=1 Tax=Desulforegula conservatrix TaxID=153026 RepID=UPI0003FA42D6|nr:lipase secretion chaperone [Desulforegula conservatrix]
MTFQKKKVLAILGILIIIIAGAGVLLKKRNAGKYIFDKDDGISMSDLNSLRQKIDFEGVDPSQMGITGKVNQPEHGKSEKESSDWSDGRGPMVLKYFRFLQSKYNSATNLAGHCSEVWKYLISVMPQNEAERIYAIYKKYLDCEIELAKKISEFGQPKTLDEILDRLSKVQDFRRNMLGEEMADGLYGAEIKAREYSLRRGSIVSNNELYGVEKENSLKELTSDMWEENAEQVQSIQTPYNKYREKLEIYSKDLNEMGSEEEREEKIAEFRQQFFSSDTLARLEDIDRQIKSEKESESQYREKEAEIMASANLSEKDKKEAIESLQTRYFREESEAFKRREEIRHGGEEIRAKYSR